LTREITRLGGGPLYITIHADSATTQDMTTEDKAMQAIARKHTASKLIQLFGLELVGE
jgi:hypothetical protein